MKRKNKIILTTFLLIATSVSFNMKTLAVDVAPRITDREIIESLAVLKQGQSDLNRRFDGLQNTMLVPFGSIITLIIALFGYIAWDRRTAMKPFQERFEHLQQDIIRDLDLQNKDGSLLTRLINALRELAKTDKKVAEILRTFSLM